MENKNRMRNTMFLQNYTASQFRVALSGKDSSSMIITEQMRTKEWWIKKFTEAIEDLEAGNYINGKGEKNRVSYWLDQIIKVSDFEPRY